MSTTVKQRVQMELELTGAGKTRSDVNGIATDSNKAAGGMGNLSNQFAMGAIKAQLLQAALQAVIQATKRFIDYMKQATMKAIDAQEAYNKFRVVFADMADTVDAKLQNLAESTNNSSYALRSLTADLQDLLVPMLQNREAAADLSVQTIQLAMDIASFQNRDVADVVNAMTSAYMGQTRAIRMYGVAMNEAQVNQELLNMGLSVTQQTASQAELMQARYNIILRDSADALGDAARTSDQAKGALRGLNVAWEDASITLGEKMLPLVELIAPILKDGIEDALPIAEEFIDNLVKIVEQFGPEVIQDIINYTLFLMEMGVVISDITMFLVDADKLLRDFNDSLGTFGTVAGWVINPVGKLAEGTTNFVRSVVDAGKAQDELNESLERGAVQVHANTIRLQAMNFTTETSSRVVEVYIEQLEQLALEGAVVGDTLDDLYALWEQLNPTMEDATEAVAWYTVKSSELNNELIKMERVAIAAAISNLELMRTFEHGPTVIDAEIARLRDYMGTLDELQSRFGTSPSKFGDMPTGRGLEDRGGDTGQGRKTPMDGKSFMAMDEARGARMLQIQQEIADKTAEYNQQILDKEQESWESRYELAMSFAGDMTTMFLDSWGNSFDNLDVQFSKMLEKWMKSLIASGILSAFSSAFGGGSVGLFGSLLGGGGKK